MFSTVAEGAVVGGSSGAVLGALLSFAINRNPLSGIVIGGTAGALAGGTYAYLSEKERQRQGNLELVRNDVTQDVIEASRETKILLSTMIDANVAADNRLRAAQQSGDPAKIEQATFDRNLVKRRSINTRNNVKNVISIVEPAATTVGVAPRVSRPIADMKEYLINSEPSYMRNGL